MSDYTHKEGFGSLFKNNYKEKENQPDLKGDGMFEGEALEVAAWTKTDRNGNKFLSLKFQRKQESPKEASKPEKQPQVAAGGDFDDIPFSNYEYRTLA